MVTQDDKTERNMSWLLEDGLVCDPHCSACKRKNVRNKLKKAYTVDHVNTSSIENVPIYP